MQQSHRKKRPSKKEAQSMIVKTFENELKKNYIKNMIQGQEIFAKTILDYINSGKTIDEIKSFCEKALHMSEVTEKVAMNIKEEDKENK